MVEMSPNSQRCINLRYECTCLFSCMLSSRMHHATACSALLHSLWLRVASPPIMTTSVWSTGRQLGFHCLTVQMNHM